MEKKEKTTRATFSLNMIFDRILADLIGIKGTTKSAVLNKIIEEWIDNNSDKLMTTWRIDLIGLRMLFQQEFLGVTTQRDLNNLEKIVIARLPTMFKRSKTISVEKIASHLGVHPKTVEDVIFEFGDQFDDEFEYDDGKVIKK